MKANPDFHWHGNKKDTQAAYKQVTKSAAATVSSSSAITPGKLAG